MRVRPHRFARLSLCARVYLMDAGGTRNSILGAPTPAMSETVSLVEKSIEIANRLREVTERVKQAESLIADLNLTL